MTGLLDVSFDDGNSWNNLLTLDLDAFDGINSSLDRVDERISLNLNAPGNAQAALVRFGLVHAGNDWWWAIDNVEVTADGGGEVPGDFDGNGVLDAADINDLTQKSAAGDDPPAYDLTGDGAVNDGDVAFWISELFGSWLGDANLDNEFNSGDLVQVLASGTYEIDTDAVWTTGDFDGNGRTTSGDLVTALSGGGYEAGPLVAAASVPEPTSVILLGAGIATFALWRRR
jgi:hypothetical protein